MHTMTRAVHVRGLHLSARCLVLRQYAFFGVSSRDISATMTDGNQNPSEFDLKLIMKQSLEDLYDNACQLFEERKRI
jgi:hypothetical protein